MRVPLVDGQGNFGSVDGDPPAGLSIPSPSTRSALEVLGDIDKGHRRFPAELHSSEKEPSCSAGEISELLVNGRRRIAVGMAPTIPPHNMGEVIDNLRA